MVETAAGVVEEVGKRVVGAAASILERAGVDVTEVERRLGGEFPPSVETLQTLAGEAVTAGRAGVDLAVGVARGEVEKVFERVGDQVTKVGVVLAYLETKLREVEEEAPAARRGAEPEEAEEPVPAPRAGDLFGRGWEFEDERSVGEPIVAERVEVDEPVEVDPPVPPVAPVVPVPPVSSVSAAALVRQEEAAVESAAGSAGKPAAKGAAGKAVAEKATAEKAAKKTTAKKTTAKKTTAKKTTAKKAAKKTTTVRKSATGKPADAQPGARPEAADRPRTAAKRTATKKTTVRKAASTKKPDAGDE
ncbi:hypothetical protein ACFRMQ_23050 [Kitasatospora sp. NPDC056783]|uniref:hypothetical protein n=1 Tax=Kitasatospora sp. NPDC056783 TaxID=3345943 RepID=UPI00367B1D08